MGDARKRQVESSRGPRPAVDETVAAAEPFDPAVAVLDATVDDAVAALDATVALDTAIDRGCNTSGARALQFLAGARLAENPTATADAVADAKHADVEARPLTESAKIERMGAALRFAGWAPHFASTL
jgi:hypothetical protein